jgi:hypothetical protein
MPLSKLYDEALVYASELSGPERKRDALHSTSVERLEPGAIRRRN